MDVPSLSEGVEKRYGLTGERYPFVMAYDLSFEGGKPAVLWVAVGARMGLTTLILDEEASGAVVRIDVYPGGVDRITVTSREGALIQPDELRSLPSASALADLSALGKHVLDLMSYHLDGGDLDQAKQVVPIEGDAAKALLHLIGTLQRRRSREEEARDLRERVVDNYRKAVDGKFGEDARKAPRKAVARLVFKSEAYVGRLLVEARDQGLLEETTPGRKNRGTTTGGQS